MVDLFKNTIKRKTSQVIKKDCKNCSKKIFCLCADSDECPKGKKEKQDEK
jgi:hypothetical protein